ncbi:dihydrofolate reductase family protein [Robinsoniella peoriensis]|uniref:dihydrofolate reductase family protein n=1 Tax=Robinsoniella peoriensis TaxID=180332 RepID=UPI003753979D
MRKVILFIAMSLDGYIAGKDGNIDWLCGQEPAADDMVSYFEFIKGIDTVIIGWKTYHQIVTELSPDDWMYKDLTSYVITHKELHDTENIKFVNESVCKLVKNLKEEPGKDIWICGGATVIQPLVQENLIDKFHISIIPTILGNGISLFEITEGERQKQLKLIKSQSYNGITDVIYELR